VSTQRVRRLTDDELDGVVSDLLGVKVTVFAGRVPDARAEGYDDDARGLVVSGPKLDAYVAAAEEIAPRLTAKAQCFALDTPRACAERFARDIAPRAFGRPVTDDEIADLLTVYDSGDTRENAMNALAQAILVAPSTLYRTEIGDQSGMLDDYEIASQLSFLITGARPDADLTAAAARGELHDPNVVRTQATRLLATPRARDQRIRFFVGWLELAHFEDLTRLGIPELTPSVKTAMSDEASRFVTQARTFDDLFGPIHPDARLSVIYGGDPDPITRRGGVLALAAFLTQHSGIDATNPVDRGLFVRSRMLCQELGSPPLEAFKVPIPPASDKSTTTRQKYEAHSKDPQCASCHSMMDPIGFGLERFDAIGRYREKEHGQDVDDTGALSSSDVDGEFRGPAALATKLVGSDEARACFVTQMYRWAEGRRPDDPCELATLTDGFIAQGDGIDALILSYVTRREFFVRKVTP
jgi:hypothetical protein